jgi:hypothetical protein
VRLEEECCTSPAPLRQIGPYSDVMIQFRVIAVSRSLADQHTNLQSERAHQTNGMLDDASNRRRPVGVTVLEFVILQSQ